MGKSSSIQSHTDKYSLIGALDPDTDEIKPLKMGDAVVNGLGVQLFVWDTSELEWVKMEQPTIEAGDLYVAIDDLEQYTLDKLDQYKLSGYVVSGDDIYVGYEDKDGNYYVKYIDTATGVVTYAVGTGGIVAPGSYSGLSFGSFASKF